LLFFLFCFVVCRDNLIASEFEYSFMLGWRIREEPHGLQSRKERMCATIENIVATAITQLNDMRAQADAAATSVAATTAEHDALSRVASPVLELKEPSRLHSPSPSPSSSSSSSSTTDLRSSLSSSALSLSSPSSLLQAASSSAAPSGLSSRCASSSALSSSALAAGEQLAEDASGALHSRSASASASAAEHGQRIVPILGEGELQGASEANSPVDALMVDDAVTIPASAAATAGTAGAGPASSSSTAGSLAGSAAVSSGASASTSCGASDVSASSAGAVDWDSVEVRLVAEALKAYALTFMRQPDGKPDDLSILVAKIKKQHNRAE
jgi:hypothetical protein